MRYLCTPAKKYYAPMVSPDLPDAEQAKTWADLKAPERGPWEVEPVITLAEHTAQLIEDDIKQEFQKAMARSLDAHTRAVIANTDPDYLLQMRRIEEQGL
jgi:hypothetical protein